MRCRMRVKSSVWWPGVAHQIAQMVEQCSECARVAGHRKEPMLMSPLPDYLWQVIGSDLERGALSGSRGLFFPLSRGHQDDYYYLCPSNHCPEIHFLPSWYPRSTKERQRSSVCLAGVRRICRYCTNSNKRPRAFGTVDVLQILGLGDDSDDDGVGEIMCDRSDEEFDELDSNDGNDSDRSEDAQQYTEDSGDGMQGSDGLEDNDEHDR